MSDASYWIDRLDLEPHPEGGYYRETYRADVTLPVESLPDRFEGARDASALIYFLLPGDEYSALHRIRQDEAWHFYEGSSLTLHQIRPDGTYSAQRLARTTDSHGCFHTVVPAETWFGATVDDPDRFALVGCTTAPAFDFADFELADEQALIERYPEHESCIERLTRNG